MNILNLFLKVKSNITLLLSIFLYILLCNNCTNTKRDKIIFKVGDIEINEYIYNRNLEKFKKSYFNQFIIEPPQDSIEKWRDNYIKNLFFSMAAKEAKLDTTEALRYKLDVVKKHQISKLNGLYWGKIIKPELEPGQQEIEECYKKRNKTYYFKIIDFVSEIQRNSFLNNDTIINSVEQFIQIYTYISNNNPYLAGDLVMQYPFAKLPHLKDTLGKIPQGQPIGPIRSYNHIIYILINLIEDVELPLFSKEKDIIREDLVKVNEFYSWNQLYFDIIKNANIHIVDSALILNVKENYLSLKEAIINNFENTGNEIIAEFFANTIKKNILVKDIIYLLNEKPGYTCPRSKEDIIASIKEIVFNETIYNKSLELKLLEDNEFTYRAYDYETRLLTALYKHIFIIRKIEISDEEITEYYKNHEKEFKEAIESSFTILSFNSWESAYNSIPIINNILRNKKYELLGNGSLFPGLYKHKGGIWINKENNKYGLDYFNEFIKIDQNRYYGPIQNNLKFDVLIKEADLAFRQLNMIDVKERIRRILTAKKFKKLADSEFDKLKMKYKLKTL